MRDVARSLWQHVLQECAHGLLARDIRCPDVLRAGRFPAVLDALLSVVHVSIVADGYSIHRPEVDRHSQGRTGVDDLMDLVGVEDLGKRLRTGHLHVCEGLVLRTVRLGHSQQVIRVNENPHSPQPA